MTAINQDELSQILYVDQALMWCVIELQHANHHPENYWLDQTTVIRPEAKNYVQWKIVQDDYGKGAFIFTGLLPIVNPHPMKSGASIIECVQAYTLFTLPDEEITFPTSGKGMLLPEIPSWVNTLEKLLVFLVQIVEAVNRYTKLINSLTGPDIVITGPVPTFQIGTDGSSPMINDVPKPDPLIEGAATSADGVISQYQSSNYDPNATPGWYQEALDYMDSYTDSGNGSSGNDGGNNGGGEPVPVDPGSGNNGGILDTLPVCKEQDPSIISFSKDGLLNFISK